MRAMNADALALLARMQAGERIPVVQLVQVDFATTVYLTTAGGLRNGPHHTIAGIDADCPNPRWEYAAAYGARNAVFLNVDVARPTQTGLLSGLTAPRAGRRFGAFRLRRTADPQAAAAVEADREPRLQLLHAPEAER